MDKKIDEAEFIIFDTETTGLNPEAGDRIVELAAIRWRAGKEIAQFETFIDPKRPIQDAAFEVNRITPQMLQNAPEAKDVMPRFLAFIQDACICSYNAAFDLGFINSELKRLGLVLPKESMVVDILRMARRLLPGLERYALWFVAEKMGATHMQEHRALSDVKLTLEVFEKFLVRLKPKGVLDTLHLVSLFGVNSELWEEVNGQKIAKIQEAIDLGLAIRIQYLSNAMVALSERQVVPKEITRDKGRAYLIGHCCLRNEERTFRVDNIISLEIVKAGK
jgi:DNA polymerase III epsilon subunit